MISLGLDPSLTAFGWCIHDSTAFGPARVLDRGRFSTPARDLFVIRYMHLRDAVGDLLDRHPEIRAAGVESPAYGEQYSEGMYGLYLYVAEALYTHRMDVVYFDPQTLKFLAKMDASVIKGKMGKSDMVDAARADTGIRTAFNHNEADAYHAARFGARFWELWEGTLSTGDLTPSELHTFTRTHTYSKGARAGKTVRSGTLYREDDRFFRFSALNGVQPDNCNEDPCPGNQPQ